MAIIAFIITMTLVIGNSFKIADGNEKKLKKLLLVDAFTAVVIVMAYLAS